MKSPTPAGFGGIEWSTSGPHPVGWPTSKIWRMIKTLPKAKTEGFHYHLQIWLEFGVLVGLG